MWEAHKIKLFKQCRIIFVYVNWITVKIVYFVSLSESFIQRSTMFLFSPQMTYSPFYNILYRIDFFRIPLLHIDINMNIMPKYAEY